MEFRDYYAVLGISRQASDKEIKQAYRKLARQYHPDVNPNDKNAESRFREINEAYTVLSDPEKRKRYDELGANWDKVQTESAPRRGGHTFHFTPGSTTGTFENLFGSGGGFSDFFQAFFGGDQGFSMGRQTEPSADTYEIEVTLDEAYHGTAKTFVIPLKFPCARCGGRGTVRRSLCPDCKGQRSYAVQKNVEVRIPRGIREGQTLRLMPEGQEIHLKVKFRSHPFFKRRENGDLNCEVQVSLLDCVLGGEVEIPTLKGKTIMKIPAGTQNSTVLRLKGLGMPSNGKNSDLFVTLKVALPTSLTSKEKSLYEELRGITKK